MKPAPPLDQLAVEGALRPVRRMGHRVAHQHQARPVAAPGDLDDEIAHGVTPPAETALLQDLHHRSGQKGLNLWIALKQGGLGTGKPHKTASPLDETRGLEMATSRHGEIQLLG